MYVSYTFAEAELVKAVLQYRIYSIVSRPWL